MDRVQMEIEHLAQVDQMIDRSRARLHRLAECITRARASGQSVLIEERTIRAMHATLSTLHDTRLLIEETLRRLQAVRESGAVQRRASQ